MCDARGPIVAARPWPFDVSRGEVAPSRNAIGETS